VEEEALAADETLAADEVPAEERLEQPAAAEPASVGDEPGTETDTES
jgi:hypothetical protein